MPEKKNAQKPNSKKAKAQRDERKVVYDRIEVNGVEIPAERLKITEAKMKTFLGWETEDEHKDATKAEKGVAIGFGDDYLLIDEDGAKVRCNNNASNRKYIPDHCSAVMQDILAGQWEFNGETIIVGRTALALSIQHRGIALIRACQAYRKSPERYPYWSEKGEEPYITALVVTGVSEDKAVVKTLDNTAPRTDADVIYTSGVFDKLDKRGKDECSRMYAAATKLLWDRTNAGGEKSNRTYQTHSASDDFRSRHPKLLQCVKHVFEVNQERGISRLRLSAGQVAACLYLMGSCESEPREYYAPLGANRVEKKLTWAQWDRACDFIAVLGNGGGADDDPLVEVRKGIAALVESETGGRAPEKIGLLAKAWRAWVDRGAVTAEDLVLEYAPDSSGVMRYIDSPRFGGIDYAGEPHDPEVSEEEAQEAIEQERKQKAAKDEKAAKRKANKHHKGDDIDEPIRTIADELIDLRRAHPGKVLLFDRGSGYGAWGTDAKDVVGPLCKILVERKHNLPFCEIPGDKLEEHLKTLLSAGHKVAIVEKLTGQQVVTEHGGKQ